MQRLQSFKNRANVVNLMLDSGAFSAFKRSETIDVHAYIEFIKSHSHLLYSYVNLDVLPFGREQDRTEAAIERAAADSFENLQIMKDAGLNPIPVFHQGERFEWLEKMIDSGEPYIGVSTRKDLLVFESMQRTWLDNVFSRLCDSKGKPFVKIHGFGITKRLYLQRYPFYSVDSTKWALGAGYGKVVIPPYFNGVPDYTRKASEIIVSEAPQRSKFGTNLMRFEYLSPALQETVLKFLHDEVGVTRTDVRYFNETRRRAILVYFNNLAAAIDLPRFKHCRPALSLSDRHSNPVRYNRRAPVKIMFASSMNRQFGKDLMATGSYNQLLSYYELRNIDPKLIERYVKTGLLPEGRRGVRNSANWKEAYLNVRRRQVISRSEEGSDAENGSDKEPGQD